MSLVKGQLETLVPFQAEVAEVFPDGRIKVKISEDKTEIIPPVYYGGVRDSGTFMHPDIGDILLCTRVRGGSKGVTQAIAVLAAEGREVRYTENSPSVPIGASPYPKVRQGDVKILSNGGSELFLTGEPGNSEIHLATSERSGLFISSDLSQASAITSVATLQQQISSGSRLVSGDIIRSPEGGQTDVPIGHDLECFSKISGDKRGFFPGAEAQDSCFFGSPRNPVLSEYRLVVNEFSERSAFTGFDQAYSAAVDYNKKEYTDASHKSSIDPRTSLSLAPHQLVEVIAGNVVNSRGESLDINYGVVTVGNADGEQVVEEAAYEADNYTSRRGLGYHFQLSTNAKSKAYSTIETTLFVP